MKVFRKGIEVIEIKDFKQVGRFMEVAQIECTVKSPEPIAFEIGDYVVYDYNNLTYSLYDVPTPKKQARSGSYGEAFIYELRFKADTEQLDICPFLDLVANDNGAHYTSLPSFSTFENVYGIVARLQANMNYLYPNKWKFNVVNTSDAELSEALSEAKEFSISGESCLEGLKKIYDTWGVSYIHTFENGKNVITLGKSAGTTSLFRYGKGQGLRTIKRNVQNADQLCTRAYVYGSTRNIPARWYNDNGYIGDAQYAPNLMIPPSKWKGGVPQGAYIDAVFNGENRVEKYGLRIKTLSYDGSDNNKDEIFPSVEKVTAKNIRDAKAELGETTYVPSSRYSNTERMDEVLYGVVDIDDGISTEAGYVLYSDVKTVTIEAQEETVEIAEYISETKYERLESKKLISLCSFEIDKLAQYKPVEIQDFIRFEKNDLESTISASLYLKRPSGDFIPLKSTLVFTNKLEDSLRLSSELVDVSEEVGTYTLVAEISVGWSADYVIPQFGEKVTLKYTIDDNIVELKRGERKLSDDFDIHIKQIGFDINSCTAANGAVKTISFKNGLCAGRSFSIKKCQYDKEIDAWKLTCARSEDSSISQRFPNSIFPVSAGDQFVLININMPDLYVHTAMQRLYDTAISDLKYLSLPQYQIEPEIDNIQMLRSPQVLKEGMYMPIEDADLGLNEEILIDSVTITNKEKEPRKFDVVLRNDKIYNKLNKLASRISDLENTNAQATKAAANTPVKESQTNTEVLTDTTNQPALFERVNLGTEEEPVWGVIPKDFNGTKVGIVSNTFITAGGRKSESEDEPQGSATTLGGLVNVEDNVDAIYDKVKVLVKLANATHFTLADFNAVAGLDEKQLKEYLDKNAYLNKTEADKLYATLTQFNALKSKIDTFLDSENLNGTIDRWKEVESFLLGYTDQQTLAELLNAKADVKSLNSLSDKVDTKADNSTVQGLSDRVDDLSADVSNKADKSTVTTLSNTVSGLAGDVSDNTDAISQNAKDIAANTKNISANATAISNLSKEDTRLSNAIDALSDNVDGLSTEVTRVSNQLGNKLDKTDISGLSTTVENLRIDVEDNTDRIESLEGNFTNGSAKNALQLDGKSASYFATASSVSTLNTDLTNHIAAYNKHIQDYNSFKGDVTEDLNELMSMFEWQTVGGVRSIKAKAGLWSDSFITAGGYNSENGGGVAYDRLDNWSDYNANSGAVLSAKLGYGLKVEIDNLKAVDHFNETKLNNYLVKNNYLTKANADSYYASVGTVAALDTKVTNLNTKVTDIDNRLKVIEGYWGVDATLNALYPKNDRGIYSNSFITAGGANDDSGSGGGLSYFEVVIPNMGTFGLGSNGKVQLPSYPEMLPASDVYAWAKAANKPTYTKAEVGLGNVQNVAVYTRELGVNGTNWTFASTYYTADGKSTSIYAPTSAGTAGQYLVSNGAGAPYWYTINPYDANKSRTANTVLAAPNGSNGAATFRTLVAADIPNLDWSKITSGKPTTLSGYGITDGITKAAADLSFFGLEVLGIDASGTTNLNKVGYGYATKGWWGSGPAIAFGSTNGYTALIQQGSNTHSLYVSYKSAGGDIQDWKTIAFTDSNVASAKKLAYNSSTVGLEVNNSGNVIIQGSHLYSTALHTSDIGTATMPFRAVYTRYLDTYDGYDLRFRTGGTEQMRIAAASGCVILGDSSVADKSGYKLYVNDSTYINGNLSFYTGAINWLSDNNYSIQVKDDGVAYYKAYYGHRIYTGGSQRMFIDSSGNVGIGVTSPSYKLDVSGIGRFTNSSDGSGVVIANQGNTIDGYYNGWGNLYLNYSSSGDVYLAYGGGNVGIGTRSTAHKLDILSNDWIGLRIKRNKSTGYGSAMVFENTSGLLGVMGWNQEGDFIIREGRSNKLIEGGTSGLKINYSTSVKGNITATGEITAGSASDRRLKDNIQSMTEAQAKRVLSSLNPVTFQWNAIANQLGSHSGYSDGFIADEYESLIPNSGRSIWTHYRAIDYTRVSSYLVKGWQNHETRLEAAERRIKELETELAQYRRA